MKIFFRDKFKYLFKKGIFLSTLFVLITPLSRLYSQSIRENNSNLYNDYFINPADLKTDSSIQLDIIGLLNKPESTYNLKPAMFNSILSLNTLSSAIRIGVYSDFDNFHTRAGATFGYAYHHNLSDNITINGGVSSDFFKTTEYNENHYGYGREIKLGDPIQMDFNIGASFNIYNFYIGNSYYSIKSYGWFAEVNTDTNYFWRLNTYYSNKITLKYKFRIGNNFTIKTLLSVATSMEDESDNISLLAEYKEIIGLGIGTRGRSLSGYYFHKGKYKFIVQFNTYGAYTTVYNYDWSLLAQLQFMF